MIWFLVSFLLVGVLSVPGDLPLQRSTAEPRRRAAEVVTDLERSIRLERAFDELDALRSASAGELERHAILFGDALARPATTKQELQALRGDLDRALRAAWTKQIEVRARLRAAVSAEEWQRIFPAPR
ncbi:MAG: hypothetical protein JNM84_05050 [Planctomycetes bacterium]|nr:hypothetical protein [Planctomycetota bacterium]